MDLVYDCPFVFGEVNADRVTWLYDPRTGEKKLIYSETKSIGQNTSTKAVGSYSRQDVTDNYKYPEGKANEAGAFLPTSHKLGAESGGPKAAGLMPGIDITPTAIYSFIY